VHSTLSNATQIIEYPDVFEPVSLNAGCLSKYLRRIQMCLLSTHASPIRFLAACRCQLRVDRPVTSAQVLLDDKSLIGGPGRVTTPSASLPRQFALALIGPPPTQSSPLPSASTRSQLTHTQVQADVRHHVRHDLPILPPPPTTQLSEPGHTFSTGARRVPSPTSVVSPSSLPFPKYPPEWDWR
jgi:hypothetical protein